MNNGKKTKSIIILTTLIVLTSIWGIPFARADSVQVTTSNTYLTAGQENDITIILRNIGDRSVVGVQAVLSSTTPGISIIDGSQRVYTVIEDKETKGYTSTLYVDKTVPMGSYTLTLTVTYQKITFEYVTSTVSVGVVVGESYTPKLGLNIDPDSINAIAGVKTDVSYELENIANKKLKDLELVTTSTSPYITITGGDTIRKEVFGENESIIINPTLSVLESTPLTTYTLTFTASFSDESEKTYFESYTLPVNVNSAKTSKTTTVTIKEVSIKPSTVYPGDIFDLDIALDCTGANAYDLMSIISFPQMSPISPLTPSTIDVGDLNSGENTSYTYNLLASGSAPAGQYAVTITISYTNNKGIPKTLTETVTIMVDGLVDFQLLDTPSQTTAPGETNEMDADLLLIGTESVDFVSIRVMEDDLIKRVSGSDEYIGAVDPDSPIPFDIYYKVDEDAPEGEHKVKLDIKYRDHLNREKTQEISFDITIDETVDDEPQRPQGGIWLWIRRLLGLGP